MVVLLAAALLATLFAALFANPAEAKKRHHHHHKKKQQVQVTNITNNVPLPVVSGQPVVLNLTNPADATDKVVVGAVKVLDSTGKVIKTINVPDLKLAPGEDGVVTITDPLVNADKIRLVDASGDPITVIDKDGVTVGDIDVDVA